MDILEQRANYQYGGGNVPRRQPIAQGYEPHRFQQRQAPQQPSYPYDQSIPPSFEKAEYYSPSSTEDQRDIFRINPFKPKKPWYRTIRGLLILFVVILLVAGAAVGITFGVRAAMNKAAADQKAAQRNGQAGNGVGEKGGGVTIDSTALPTLPSLILVTLGSTQQAAASIASPANLVLTLKSNPAPAITAPQARPAVPQATGT